MYEIFMDDKSLYYPGDKINVVTEAKIREALDDAGYMDITVPPTNPLYESIQERKTDIEVYKDNKSIWEGEVRDISDNMKKEKKLYVVGVVSFLNDSIQSPRHINQAPVQALGELLNEHNSQVELKKQFKLGVVTIDVPEIDIDVDYESTLSVIRDKICSKYAGYLRVRKEDGIKYIDVVKIEDYGTTCKQPLEFGSNLLDYAKNITTDSIATSVVPLGKETKNEDGIKSYVTIESVNDGKNYIYDQDAVNSFGWIKRIVKFKDVEDPLVLLEEGEKWLKENQYAQLTMKLKAVDLSLLNADIDSFNLGDNVNAKAKPFGLDAWYYIRDKETDLLHPANNSVTVGNTVLKGYTQKVKEEYKEMEAIIPNSTEFLEAAKQNATNLIKLATTGYIHLVMDENGNPKELLIMDTADIQTAHKIWRWNINGLGYSSTGYDGEYELAMTMDGSIVADRITTGILNANLIRTGKIQDAKGNNYWDMETGEFRLAGTTIVGSSTVASKQDAKNEADRAEENANSATDEKLRDYSTTTESQSYADKAANNAANALNSSLDMEEIFNRLTKDGTVKGIYLIDGQLYVNASYIKSGTLSLGDENNGNGRIEMFNSSGDMVGEWDCDGFKAQTDSYMKTNYLPKYFENNYFRYPYYDADLASGDYIASYVIELDDKTTEHKVYVKFISPNLDMDIGGSSYYDASVIYEYTVTNGRLVLTVSNWFYNPDYQRYVLANYPLEKYPSIAFGNVEKIWSPTAGIAKIQTWTGGKGTGQASDLKYSYDNKAVEMCAAGMNIDTENGKIESDHYSITEDGLDIRLDVGEVDVNSKENSRVNLLNLSKNGMSLSAFQFDNNNKMSEYKYMELLTSLYEAGFKFKSPHVNGSPECYFGLAGIKNTAVNNKTTSGGSNVRVATDGQFYKYASSSKRYKTDVTTEIKEELSPEKLYDLNVVQYKYNDDYLTANDQRYGKDFIGFIAEEVSEVYPLACNVDSENRPEMWEIGILFPALLKLVQEQKKLIDKLEERVDTLEKTVKGGSESE